MVLIRHIFCLEELRHIALHQYGILIGFTGGKNVMKLLSPLAMKTLSL